MAHELVQAKPMADMLFPPALSHCPFLQLAFVICVIGNQSTVGLNLIMKTYLQQLLKIEIPRTFLGRFWDGSQEPLNEFPKWVFRWSHFREKRGSAKSQEKGKIHLMDKVSEQDQNTEMEKTGNFAS